MILTVVGSAGSVAGPGNPASCYLLQARADDRTWSVVLDLGSGAIGPLQSVCDPAGLDAVLISHGHADHCADVYALSVLLRYGPALGPAADAPRSPLPLVGPVGTAKRVLEIAGSSEPTALVPFAVSELDPTERAGGEAFSIGPFRVTTAPVWHSLPGLAWRIEGPGEAGGTVALVYTGDTDRCDAVDALAAGADVLLAEAGWAHREINPPGIHMNGAQAGQMASEVGAKRLIVTHVASWVDAAPTLEQARLFAPGAALAQPGDVITM